MVFFYYMCLLRKSRLVNNIFVCFELDVCILIVDKGLRCERGGNIGVWFDGIEFVIGRFLMKINCDMFVNDF